MRKTIVAGNWKMNKTPSEAKALIEELKPLVASETSDVVFCVPAIDIPAAIEAAEGSNIAIGAENMYFEESGAYTGEIAPNMLTDLGVKYVIIGHSERREYFAETDETVNKKVLKAFEHGITPIICCGETLTQREQGVTIDFVRQQIKIAFQNVTAEQAALLSSVKNLAALIFAAAEAVRVYILPRGCIEHYYTRNHVSYMPVTAKDRLFHTERKYLSTAKAGQIKEAYTELINLLEQVCMKSVI